MKILGLQGNGFSSNVFLIEIDRRFILVDCGVPSTSSRTIDFIRKNTDVLESTILTHRHFDHAGGLSEVLENFDCPAFAHPLEAEPLRKGDPLTTGAMMFGGRLEKIPVQDLTEDVFGDEFEIIQTPGHTEGSICIYHRKSASLISGDTVFADGGVGRWDLPTGSVRQLRASINLLEDLSVTALYPGHGRWVEEDGHEHIKMSAECLRGF